MLLRSIHLLLIFVTLSIAGLPGFTITSPTNDQPFCDNTTITVTWKAPAKRPVYVEYSFNNGTSWTLIQKKPFFTGANGVGSTTISIPEGLATDNGKVRLSKALSIPIFVDDIPIFSWKKSDKEWLVHSFSVRNLESSTTVVGHYDLSGVNFSKWTKVLTSDYSKVQCDVISVSELNNLYNTHPKEAHRATAFNNLEVGDIIVLDQSITHNVIPQCRRIISIIDPDAQGKRTFTTVPVLYLDAIGTGVINFSKEITEDDVLPLVIPEHLRKYIGPITNTPTTRSDTRSFGYSKTIPIKEMPLTLDGKITISGTLEINIKSVNIKETIKNGQVTDGSYYLVTEIKSDLSLNLISALGYELDKDIHKLTFLPIPFPPIPIPYTPIVITPQIDLSFAMEGEFGLGFKPHVIMEGEFEVGTDIVNGEKKKHFKSQINKAEFDGLTGNLKAELKVYTPLTEVKFKINEVVAPQFEIGTYFATQGDPFANPTYRIWRGVNGSFAIQINDKAPKWAIKLSKKGWGKLLTEGHKFYDYQKTIKCGPPQYVTIDHKIDDNFATISWIEYDLEDQYRVDNLTTAKNPDVVSTNYPANRTARVPVTFGSVNNIDFQIYDKHNGLSDPTKVSVIPRSTPHFITKSLPNAVEYCNYSTKIEAKDKDGDIVLFEFAPEAAPVPPGMSINSTTGVISWRAQNATTNLKVPVKAYYGKYSTTKVFTLNVVKNTAPVITGVNKITPGSLYSGETHKWQLQGKDDQGQPFTFRFMGTKPKNMHVSTDGIVTWTPDRANYKPTFVFGIIETGTNLTTSKIFTDEFEVGNRAPVINTNFLNDAITGHEYSQDISVTDPDGGKPFLSISKDYPLPPGFYLSGNTIKGKPHSSEEKVYTIEVIADDYSGAFNSKTSKFLTIHVALNRAPEVSCKEEYPAICDRTFYESVSYYDFENDDVTFSLVSGPKGFTVDPDGSMSWYPTKDNIGKHLVTIMANDGCNGYTTKTFTVFCAPELYSIHVILFDKLYADGQYGYDEVELYVSRFGEIKKIHEGTIELEKATPATLGHKPEFEFNYLREGDKIFIKGLKSANNDDDKGKITAGYVLDVNAQGDYNGMFPEVATLDDGTKVLSPGGTATLHVISPSSLYK